MSPLTPRTVIDHVLIDIPTCDLTTRAFIAEAERLKAQHPSWEVFLDGDRNALVGREVI